MGKAASIRANVAIRLGDLETFAHGLDHAEGIAITPAGTIYVGGEAGQIYRIDNDSPIEVANTGGFILGLASDAMGRIYAIDNFHKCVWLFDPLTLLLVKWIDCVVDAPIRVPNWGAFGPDGSYYLTDSGDWDTPNGCIWVREPSGALRVFSNDAINFPNGCAVSPDGSTLYYVESAPFGAICQLSIDEFGATGPREVLCELGVAVPDGITIASDHSLIVACYRPDAILRWSAESGLETVASDPQGTVLSAPTNIAFGGAEHDVLIVPNLGRWHLTRGNLGIAGAPLHYPNPEKLHSV